MCCPLCGKTRIRLVAFTDAAGALRIRISDDGRGIDAELLRAAVVRKGLARKDVAAQLRDAELFEFMFLPGFSSKDQVTEISGRGYGLDAVQTIIKDLGGNLAVTSRLNSGTTFELNLPLTLSVLRTLVVDIAGQTYAFPLGRLFRALALPSTEIQSVEGRLHFSIGDEQIGLVSAHQVLQFPPPLTSQEVIHVVVLGTAERRFGMVVDAFLANETVLVKPLDPRLGKVHLGSVARILASGTE